MTLLACAVVFILISCGGFVGAGPGVHDIPPIVGRLGGHVPTGPLRSAEIISDNTLSQKDLSTFLDYMHVSDSWSPSGGQRVSFGEFATGSQFQWAARLNIQKDDNSTVMCSGSLITPRTILTAAHCLYDDNSRPSATDINVYIGDISMASASSPLTGKSFMSAGYAPSRTGNQMGDLALIELADPSSAVPVTLDDGDDYNSTDTFVVVGWGMNETQQLPQTLKWTFVPGISELAFKKWMETWAAKEGVSPLTLEADHVVAGLGMPRADACLGDSGGALVLPGPEISPTTSPQTIQVGLVSYGLTSECGGQVNVGMYTKVGYWRTWIDDMLSIYNLRGAEITPRRCGLPSNTCLVGGDLTKLASTSAGSCCDACRDSAVCSAWSWDSNSNICSLKKNNKYKVKSGSQCTSGPMVVVKAVDKKKKGSRQLRAGNL